MKYTNAKQSIARAVFETLEGRTCMSASVTLQNGVLLLQADANTPSVMQVQYEANHAFVSAYTPYVLKQFPTSQINKIVIIGSNKDDSIYIDPNLPIPASINAGAGDDTIHGGSAFSTINGGDGNDLIYGHGIISGGNGNDTIWGSNQGDEIFGGAGDDMLFGGTGNDMIVGGSGKATINAGLGNDEVWAGQSGSKIQAGPGKVTVVGGSGQDTIYGGGGGTTIYAGSNDAVTLRQGDKVLKTAGPVAPTDPAGTNNQPSNSGSGSTGTTTPPVTKPVSNPTPTPTPVQTPPVTKPLTPPPTSNPPSTPPASTGNSVVKGTITQLETNIIAGQGVNVNALSSALNGQSALTINYHWNFGDPGSEYNDLPGWTAGHVYDKPGVYTITLVMTDSSGKTSTATSSVTVASDNRPIIYVDNVNGSDSNNGLTPDTAVKTPVKAISMISSNVQILFHRGQSWDLNQTLRIQGTNVTVGAYGTGANPVIVRGVGDGVDCFYIYKTSSNIVFQDLTFDSIWPAVNGVADLINASGIEANGTNLVVRGCTFLNITDAVNGELQPNGVIMLDNQAPLQTGLRGYLAWLDGRDWTILGNYVLNSTRQHGIRGNSTALVGVLIYDNNIQQHLSASDPGETWKCTVNIRAGSYVYIADNSLTNGTVSFAPGPGMDASEPVQWIVLEDNYFHGAQVYVKDYTRHLMMRDNVSDVSGTAQIHLYSADTTDPLAVLQDITITHNTGLNYGTTGQFLEITGNDTSGDVTLTGNLYYAPSVVAANLSCAVYIHEADLRAFNLIDGNIWDLSPANGMVSYIAGSAFPNGYLTADQWNAMAQVRTDLILNVTRNGYQATADGVTAGASGNIAA
jgi:hypothetical protein